MRSCMIEGLPKVDVGSMGMSCHWAPYETLTVIEPSPGSRLSRFCTSIPPGLSSHWISAIAPLQYPFSMDGDDDDPLRLLPLLAPFPSLELPLEDFFDLSLIIIILSLASLSCRALIWPSLVLGSAWGEGRGCRWGLFIYQKEARMWTKEDMENK